MDWTPVVVSIALPSLLALLANYFVFKAIRNRRVIGALLNTVVGVFSGLWLAKSLSQLRMPVADAQLFYDTAIRQGPYLFAALMLIALAGGWLSRAELRAATV